MSFIAPIIDVSTAEHWFLSYFPWPGWCVDLALHRMLETMCSLQSDGLPSTLLHQLGLRVSHGARRWPLLNGQLKRPLPNQGPSRKENPRPKQPRKPELSGAGETIWIYIYIYTYIYIYIYLNKYKYILYIYICEYIYIDIYIWRSFHLSSYICIFI